MLSLTAAASQSNVLIILCFISFVSVPDNTVMTLSYRNPSTGATETCSDSCPLSLDSSIPFQDFLFADGGRELTGFQLTLLKWREEGPGLHLIELLSDGERLSWSSLLAPALD